MNVENQYCKYYSLIINLHIFLKRTLSWSFVKFKYPQTFYISSLYLSVVYESFVDRK